MQYDLLVIGAGSGGVRAARMSAATGANVAVIEERYLGGTCVNVGCVPKKLFVYASHYAEDFENSVGFGWEEKQHGFDWETLRDNKTAEIERLNGIYGRLLDNAGVELIEGRGVIIDANTVRVGDQQYSTKRILIATGGWPYIPDFPGSEHAIDSNQVFYLDTLPKRPVVVGGGYIAVEFAGIFNGLGCDTTLLYRGDTLLKRFDQDLSRVVTREMQEKGIDVQLQSDIASIEKSDEDHYVLTLKDGRVIHSDCVLYATGRKPLFDGLGLDTLGLDYHANGKIKVDDSFCTSAAGVYALGDIIDSEELTPVAIAEAMVFVDRVFKGGDQVLNYDHIATAVFCQPNIGTVGLSEADARKTHDVAVFESEFRAMKHTLSGSSEKTYMKLVVDKVSDLVLGVHMVGPEAGEIIQGMAVALKAGATKKVFDSTIGIHPTSAEEFVTMREAAR